MVDFLSRLVRRLRPRRYVVLIVRADARSFEVHGPFNSMENARVYAEQQSPASFPSVDARPLELKRP